MDLQGKKVLVFGAGISGIGSCGLLEKEGAEVILYDFFDIGFHAYHLLSIEVYAVLVVLVDLSCYCLV